MDGGWCCLLAGIWSCSNPPEQIPAYIRIGDFVVTGSEPAQWQDISEGWLYVNGEFLGAYSLPDTVPVLAAGASDVWVFPGVRENGLSVTPNTYDFLNRHEAKINLEPATITPISPTTSYKTTAIFPWAIGRTTFDEPSTVVYEDRDEDAATNYVLTTEEAFAGKCLRMEVTTDHPTMKIASEAVTLPVQQDKQTWLEMHYRNDCDFQLLLTGSTGNNPEQVFPQFQFQEKAGWTKIYLNLTSALVSSGESKHRLMFWLQLPKGGTVPVTSARVWLDNIRLIHF